MEEDKFNNQNIDNISVALTPQFPNKKKVIITNKTEQKYFADRQNEEKFTFRNTRNKFELIVEPKAPRLNAMTLFAYRVIINQSFNYLYRMMI